MAAIAVSAITAYGYTDDDLYRMSHLINGEAGSCSRDMMLSVGSVVLNRMADERFPDTIADVIFQPGQYSCTWDGNYDREPSEEAVEVAKELLENGPAIDASVVWQAEFPQGRGVYVMQFDHFEKLPDNLLNSIN